MAAPVDIHGAGASFPYPIYSKWFEEYEKRTRGSVLITGPSVPREGFANSSKKQWTLGPRMLLWAKRRKRRPPGLLSISPWSSVPWPWCTPPQGPDRPQVGWGDFGQYFSRANHPVEPSGHLQSQFRSAAPPLDILVVRRADGSGTTDIFSDYLSKVSRPWKTTVGRGKSLRWPPSVGGPGE